MGSFRVLSTAKSCTNSLETALCCASNFIRRRRKWIQRADGKHGLTQCESYELNRRTLQRLDKFKPEGIECRAVDAEEILARANGPRVRVFEVWEPGQEWLQFTGAIPSHLLEIKHQHESPASKLLQSLRVLFNKLGPRHIRSARKGDAPETGKIIGALQSHEVGHWSRAQESGRRASIGALAQVRTR